MSRGRGRVESGLLTAVYASRRPLDDAALSAAMPSVRSFSMRRALSKLAAQGLVRGTPAGWAPPEREPPRKKIKIKKPDRISRSGRVEDPAQPNLPRYDAWPTTPGPKEVMRYMRAPHEDKRIFAR